MYFLRFFALQRKRKSVEAERLEPDMVYFSLFLALQEKVKKLGTGGFEAENVSCHLKNYFLKMCSSLLSKKDCGTITFK